MILQGCAWDKAFGPLDCFSDWFDKGSYAFLLAIPVWDALYPPSVCLCLSSCFLSSHRTLYYARDTCINWNATILVVVFYIQFAKGWIQGGAKIEAEGLLPHEILIETKLSYQNTDVLLTTHAFLRILPFWMSFFGLNCFIGI